MIDHPKCSTYSYFFILIILKSVNETYKKNLMKLKNFVMVKFTEDTMVDPPISQVGELSSLISSRPMNFDITLYVHNSGRCQNSKSAFP